MIFVITGTEAFPFNRLIEELERLKQERLIKDDIYIQLGSCTYIPANCTFDNWLPFNIMCENILKADVVIAHAGAGTTLLCLELGKTPIIVTRQKCYNEHLDDHQVPFAKMMEKLDYAVVAYDISEIHICMEKLLMRKKDKNKD
jgi:UDP-N-acetylglucosamine transferase subunit ALG13